MNVLMIHGIGQEASTHQDLLAKWTESLHYASPGLLKGASVEMAYYGTTLADWANSKAKVSVGMGVDSTAVDIDNLDELKFLNKVMEEVIAHERIDEAEIEILAGDVYSIPMNNFIARRLVGMMRMVEKISPLKGAMLLKLVKQGHTYLNSPGAAKAVDNIVLPLLQRSPQIIISHSLGTVIAYKLLREMAAQNTVIKVPLFITMGSPLGLEAFKAKLGAPRKKPVFVEQWSNFYDRSDFVALGKPLDELNFAEHIKNDGTVDNDTPNAHGIVGYLPHNGVISELKRFLA